MVQRTCTIGTCDKPLFGVGMCNMHYTRKRIHGDVNYVIRSNGDMDDRARFEFKGYDLTETGCWNWRGGIDGGGYGTLRRTNGKIDKAHRVSYILHKGEITDGLWVLHSCDNPQCVNPDHLRLGTPTENMQDMMERKRRVYPVGGDNPNARITEEQAIYIKSRLREGEITQSQLARDMGINRMTVAAIATGKSWKHLP